MIAGHRVTNGKAGGKGPPGECEMKLTGPVVHFGPESVRVVFFVVDTSCLTTGKGMGS